MLIIALHVRTDGKLTVINRITRNLFLQLPKSIDCKISKKILTLTKELRTKQT